VRRRLRIASRKSPLACWQANAVQGLLKRQYPSLEIELILFTTEGDRYTESAGRELSGKGLFVKELEMALLNDQADIAVHSMKDLPMTLEDGLLLAAIFEREDPRDVLLTPSGKNLKQLPSGSSIGSSSLRRQSQLLALRADLKVSVLHGNVGTRLDKLAAGEYDAIILAAAGLIRLGKSACISEYFSLDFFLPAPGQGALGIECRSKDVETRNLISILNHDPTSVCVTAERTLSLQLGGNCQVPIAAYAECLGDQIYLRGLVAKPDGSLLIKVEKYGRLDEAEMLGIVAAKELIDRGGNSILQELI